MPAIYDSVQGNHPAKNRFDLSHTHFMTMSVGRIYVAMAKEMYPGDCFDISDAVHCQLQPMVAPLLSDLNLYAYTFFVPYRLLYGVDTEDGKSIWEKYITGGDDGDYDTPLPSWDPKWTVTGFSSNTIWDSVGNPLSYSESGSGTELDPYVYSWSPLVPKDLLVSKAPKLAYNMIWNTYFRDENLQDEVDLDNEYLLYADWKKDYFTSALESQQFGTAPLMNLTGTIPISFSNGYVSTGNSFGYVFRRLSESAASDLPAHVAGTTTITAYSPNGSYKAVAHNSVEQDEILADSYMPSAESYGTVHGLYPYAVGPAYADLSKGGLGFDVANMRLMFAVQRLMELSMSGGHRYTEYLKAHFGVSPSDARLDRPEYIGGCVFPVNVAVNVQSSETTSASPQGNKVGVGNINDIEHIGRYRAEEYGLCCTLAVIRPKPVYQQGISREWLRQNRFEYYSPEFANLSEQATYRAEIYVDPTDTTYPDNGVFGYQAHWNELRASQNFVSGAMREQFDYWLMSRKFSSRPALNADFVSLDHPAEYNRIWAVQDEDQFIVAFSNIVDAYRPLPAFGTPGLIDHVYGGK